MTTDQSLQAGTAPLIPSLETERTVEEMIGRSLWQVALRRIRRDRLTMIAIGVLAFFSLIAVLAPLIADALKVNYYQTDLATRFAPMGTPGHILGTDNLGRDILARLLFGAQVSLGIAFSAAILSLVLGVAIGVVMGYFGGIVDDLFNWLIITLGSIPTIYLLIAIAAVFQPSPAVFIVIFSLLGWTGTARLVRGESLALREREFVIGATAIGASSWRIMFSHIIPNLISLVIISLALDIGGLILTEAALSYLGLGVKPPTPSWGNMLTDAQELFEKGPHLVIIPGLLVWITVLCLYLAGDGLRDAFDPQLEKR